MLRGVDVVRRTLDEHRCFIAKPFTSDIAYFM